MSNGGLQRLGKTMENMDLPQVTGQPDRREGALAEFPDDLVLAIVEEIAEKDGVVTARVVVLHPLTGQVNGFESPLVIFWGPCWRCRRRGGAHGCNEYELCKSSTGKCRRGRIFGPGML